MTKIKNFFVFIISIIVIYILYINSGKIVDSFKEYFEQYNEDTRSLVILKGNSYERNYNFNYVQLNDDFVPHSYNDLLNIYYSTLNKGWDSFTFYCPEDYTECLNDIKTISNNKVILSNINSFVSPFNSYSEIKTLYDSTGEITIEITHLYNEYERKQLYNDINEIINNNVNDNMSDYEKIKAIHDYIINNTKYDQQRIQDEPTSSPYDSARINGVLYDHYAICSGYADTMAAALDIMGFKNYKVSSDTHVWNAVYINNKWLHLDLTWDDPISVNNSNKDVLEHTYFLVNTQTLLSSGENVEEHLFDENVFSELK